MKKFFIVLSVMLFSVGDYAQHEVGSLTIQPKVGLNITSITNTVSPKARVGLALGAELESQITNKFSLSVGALYSQQGAKSSGVSQGIYVKNTIKIDYINIPIMANVYVVRGLAFKAGIQPGININASYSGTAEGITVSGSLSDLGINIKTLDFSVPVGLSYEYKNFVLDGRYNIGVTNMAKDDVDKSKNSVFQFTIGYKFNL